MASDPYEVLGVPRTADADEIRRAYRKLAKQHHPDLNPNNKGAEERFKALNTANDLLSDPEKRARYDRGEIDAAGDPRYQAPPNYSDFAQGPRGGKYAAGGSPFGEGVDPADYEDLFADFINRAGAGPGSKRQAGPRRGRDRSYSLDVEFLDAANGTTQRLTLPGGSTLEVRIPAGLESGQVLRLKEKGDPGRNGGLPGDALIEVFVRPHAQFTRDGDNILVDLPVTLAEAVLGGRVPVPTTTGSVNLSVPPNSANGTKLRLRGRGIPAHAGRPAGDQYVTLKLVLDPNDAGLANFLRTRTDAPSFDPRQNPDHAE
jgi:DnaJ-class molecular chaperone